MTKKLGDTTKHWMGMERTTFEQRAVAEGYYEMVSGVNPLEIYWQIFQKICHNLGLNTYIEYSGGKGYHVWLFFKEWIAARYANLMQDIILSKQETKDTRLCVGCFPNKTRMREDCVCPLTSDIKCA